MFVSEVGLVLVYFLMWKRWSEGVMKKVHIGFGVTLGIMSWLTMAIIVAVLGFMMGTGNWSVDRSFISAIFNPLYAPQLLFRTSVAMMTAGLMVWFLLYFFTKEAVEVRRRAVRLVSVWVLAWGAVCCGWGSVVLGAGPGSDAGQS